MKRALIIPSKGIGDALFMMIAARSLTQSGYGVTVFHEGIFSFQEWFPKVHIGPVDDKGLMGFDRVIVQNDDSRKTSDLKKKLSTIYSEDCFTIFYPRYVKAKHGSLRSKDRVFDPSVTMVENIAQCMHELLGTEKISFETGIEIPTNLVHQKYSKRICIHPTSNEPEKNWSKSKFLILAKKLKKKGYDPQFIVRREEKKEWEFFVSTGYPVCHFDKLTDLASYLYESSHLIGNDSLLGHLASLLQIPTTIIAKDKKHMALWRPGWLKGRVICSPFWLLNCKGLRLRERFWKEAIFVSQVMKPFC